MKDLLSYNPPMSNEQKMKRKLAESSGENGQESPAKDNVEETVVEEESNGDDEQQCPRVKVGANGELVIDEESLVIRRKPSENGPLVVENSTNGVFCTTYASFRKSDRPTGQKPRWTDLETARFYTALNFVGTDFTLMAQVFFNGKRSRVDLRNKFKKEEKIHKPLIDEALSKPPGYVGCEMNHLEKILKNVSSEESEDSEDSEGQQENEKQSNPQIILPENEKVSGIEATEKEAAKDQNPIKRKRLSKRVSPNLNQRNKQKSTRTR